MPELLTKTQRILDRIQPALVQEGLEIELVGLDGDVLNIRGRRVAPGVPTAFLVKAIAGTFRRYLPNIQDVCLTEYDPGEDPQKIRSSPEFEKVLQSRAAPVALQPKGTPGVDLTDLDRAQSVRAIEAFVRMWKERGVDRIKIVGLQHDAPQRAYRKWAGFCADDYASHHPQQGRPGVQIVHLSNMCRDETCADEQPEEVMPGRILLIG